VSEVDTVHPIGGTRGVVLPTSNVLVRSAGAVEQDLTGRVATERTINLSSGECECGDTRFSESERDDISRGTTSGG